MFPVLEQSLLFGTGYPPSPLGLQNLENKRLKFSLCARSLSLQDLHAKSREHGSYDACIASTRSISGIHRDRCAPNLPMAFMNCQRAKVIQQIILLRVGYLVRNVKSNEEISVFLALGIDHGLPLSWFLGFDLKWAVGGNEVELELGSAHPRVRYGDLCSSTLSGT